ncbi:MAG: PadR family transcriptional regulator [Streptococcaceae bacterium]|jgi:PadR family transcriptional regulator PadR|nr:PadR family transcriptional regulator [Streptococcaceae bacterium]
MDIQIPTLLLDGTVLALLQHQDMYGYNLTKSVQNQLPVSESTMYPVLRRLKQNNFLETYDEPFEGRNRRYYRLTEAGHTEFERIYADWQEFRDTMDKIMKGENNESLS